MKRSWPWEKSIQTRIVVAYAAIFVLVLGLLTWWIGQIMYNSQLEQGEHELEVKAFLLANSLEDPLSGFIQEFEKFTRFVHAQQVNPEDMLGQWTIAGWPITAVEDTEFTQEKSNLILGSCASIWFELEDATFTATQISSKPCEADSVVGDAEGELYGLIEEMPSPSLVGQLTIGGQPYDLAKGTKIELEYGELAIGTCVEIEFSHADSASKPVSKLETKRPNDCESFGNGSLSGQIEATPFDAKPTILNVNSTKALGPELNHLRSFVQSYAISAEARVTVLDLWGNILTDSAYPAAEIANQRNQVEVQAALSDAEQHHVRPDPFTAVQTLYTAAPIHDAGRSIGVVQLSLPLEIVMAPSLRTLQLLIFASLVSILFMIAVGIWLGGRIASPIRRMEKAALAIAEGDLTQQVDISRTDELGSLAYAFNKMVNELNTMFTQQQNFVAHASHELRSPLVNIQLRSDALLRNEQLSDQERQYLSQISSETDRLGKLSTELLNLSQLESAAPAVPHSTMDAEIEEPLMAPEEIRYILRSLVDLLSVWSQESSIQLQLKLPEKLPYLKMRPNHLDTVVRNLVNNAIKYTSPGGKVVIEVEYEDQSNEKNASTLCIIISDTGIGIPKDDLPHIFERFFRVDKARSRQSHEYNGSSSGAGLGLSIVRNIVELYGGHIHAQSEVGKGTAFFVKIPVLGEGTNPRIPPAPAAPHSPHHY